MAVMHQNRKNNILLGQNDNALTWLILLNAVVYVGLYFVKLIYHVSLPEATYEAAFKKEVQDWLTLPTSFTGLAYRPWTLITSMFVHESIYGLIGTTLWLWAFGYILQDLAGNNKLFPVYLYGGLAAGLMLLATTQVFPALRENGGNLPGFSGGSAPVLAIAIAVTALAPKYRLLPMINGGIPLWILTLIFAIIDYASMVRTNVPLAVAHSAAGITGFLFIRGLRMGYDTGAWMTVCFNWADDLFNPAKKNEAQGEKQSLFYKATRKPYEKKAIITQQKVDDLLDKINQQGYHLLTDEEKDFLKKASEQDFNT